MEAKVFVSQENNRLSYHDAERYGDVVFMTACEFNAKNKNSILNQQTLTEIKEGMAKFDPDRDYLLLSGDPILIAFTFHLAIKQKGYVKLLKWDRNMSQYFEVHFKG